MYEGTTRHHARMRQRAHSRPSQLATRPDRIAMWAVLMGVIVMIAAAASADGSTGGVSDGSGSGESSTSCARAKFGQRMLDRGDCGTDVKTLNWILRSKQVGERVHTGKRFRRSTDRGVRRFQRRTAKLSADGVVGKRTKRKLVREMDRKIATWYGPGFWGNTTACGQTLRRRTVGVAHKRLPCGSKVVIKYRGRFLRTKVIDRGPYANGATWDLTQRAAEKLRMTETSSVRSAQIRR